MRIALVPSLVSPLRPAEANGPHAVIGDLARGLAARGHSVTVYAAPGSAVAGATVVEILVDPAAAAAAIQAGRTPPDDAVRALNEGFERLFERVRADKPDAVSQHAFDAAAIELAEGLPVLHTLHLAPIAADVVAAACATRGKMATVSRAAAAMWKRAGVRDILVLRNGVPAVAPWSGPNDPAVLVAGRISPEKGIDAALRVAHRAGLGIRIAGDVYDAEYHESCVRPLVRPGEWLGPLPRAELLALMARSAALLLPVRADEAFGLVAAEAQMAGCPVVGYRRGALPEVVTDGIGGFLVEPDDEDALAAAIPRAVELDRRRLRRLAGRRFAIGRMVRAYEAALAGVAAGRR